jgi:anti-sigma factor ChrR (cupin superfamily)
VTIDTRTIPWATDQGRELKRLYSQGGISRSHVLERWSKNATPAQRVYAPGAELLVLDGSFEDEHGRYGALTWLRLPRGFRHSPRTTTGCELYCKEGGFTYLCPL